MMVGTDPSGDHNGTDYGKYDGNVTDPDHGDGGEDYIDGNGTEGEGIPVFYLSSVNLDDLDLAETSYSEGNYIIDQKPLYYPGGIPSGLSYLWLEPVANTNGGWSLTEEEDGIQTNYTGYEYIEDYFEQNSIESVGYLHKQHDGTGTGPGDDHNGTDYGNNDGNVNDPDHGEEEVIYVSGGSTSVPYYTFSDEDGPIDLAVYNFRSGEIYQFTAVEGFTPHAFNIGSMPGIPSTYVSGDPLSAVGDSLILSIPADFSSVVDSLYFYCVAHSATMNGQLKVINDEPIDQPEQYPVFLLTPDIFEQITYSQWQWTPISREESAHFALRENHAPLDVVLPYNFSELILVNEVIFEGNKSTWVPDVDRTIYQTNWPISASELKDFHNLSIQGYYQPPKMEDLIAKVEGFWENFKNGSHGYPIDEWVTIYNAEKISDVLDPDRAIYIAELSNDISVMFNQSGEYVHSTPTSWDNSYKSDYIDEAGMLSLLETEISGPSILELWVENSALDGIDIVSRLIVESNSSELYEVFLNSAGDKIHLVTRFHGEIERDFPQTAREYMAQNYKWDDGYEMFYNWWFDESSKNFHAQLDDGTIIIFDLDGEF